MLFHDLKKKVNEDFFENKTIIFDIKNQIKSQEKINDLFSELELLINCYGFSFKNIIF